LQVRLLFDAESGLHCFDFELNRRIFAAVPGVRVTKGDCSANFQYSSIPVFQYSSIPVFQYSSIPENWTSTSAGLQHLNKFSCFFFSYFFISRHLFKPRDAHGPTDIAWSAGQNHRFVTAHFWLV